MSAWKDYTTAALLGTERAAAPALPAALEHALPADVALDRETRFLTRAGALALWRRAGCRPPGQVVAVSPAQAESGSPLSSASVGHLRAMLAGRHAEVLPEWLQEAARRERVAPPELLPVLLDRAQQAAGLRERVLGAGGRRAAWLAGHRPEWSFAAPESPETWETGTPGQRREFFRALRRAQPAEARAQLEGVWKTEPAETRAHFLSELKVHLSDDDAPFLESALDDRSREVRAAAADLLARLLSSPYVARMTLRTVPLLSFKAGGFLARASLGVTLPPEPDAAARRDGLEPKPQTQKLLGERSLLLVLHLAAVPLREWTARFGQTPAALLQAAEKSEFGRALATGWAWAALRQREAAWAEALLDSSLQAHLELLPRESLLAVLPEAQRVARLTAALRAGAWNPAEAVAWDSLAWELKRAAPWPPALAREILHALRQMAAGGIAAHFRSRVESLLLRVPPALLEEAAAGWPLEQDGVSALVDLLTFRREALAALALP